MNAEQRQVAADLWTKYQANWLGPPVRLNAHLYHLYLPSLFITTKLDSRYSSTVPRRIRRLSRPRWLVAYQDSLRFRRQSLMAVLTALSTVRVKNPPLKFSDIFSQTVGNF